MSLFFCGLDLAQTSDYTATVLVERTEPPEPAPVLVVENGFKVDRTPPRAVSQFLVRGIHRYQRGTMYPTIVEDINERVSHPAIKNSVYLVIDGTGVGRPVTDMFRRKRVSALVPVIITAGNHDTYDQGYWHVPKRNLVGAVQLLLQSGRLKIADVPERAVLLEELRNFQVKITAAGNDTYSAWREGQHDDLVLALALALWYASKKGGLEW